MDSDELSNNDAKKRKAIGKYNIFERGKQTTRAPTRQSKEKEKLDQILNMAKKLAKEQRKTKEEIRPLTFWT